MTVKKGSSPEEYAGAIQHFDEIPERYRLETYAGKYRGDNTWERFVEEVILEEKDTERIRQTARLGGNSCSNICPSDHGTTRWPYLRTSRIGARTF